MYITISRLLRNILKKCQDASIPEVAMMNDSDVYKATIADYVVQDLVEIKRLLPVDFDSSCIDKAIKEIEDTGLKVNLYDIATRFIPDIADTIDNYYENIPLGDVTTLLSELLHPRIIESSFFLYNQGKYQESVLNSIITLFDFIRERTGLDKDGADLIGEAFSLSNPYLIFSEIKSKSGQNDQKGFIQILQGAYLGIRNPKAHSLMKGLDNKKTAQYLVFASLLARRIEEAHLVKKKSNST